MGDSRVCDTNLALSIGYYDDHVPKREIKDDNKKCVTYLDLSLPPFEMKRQEEAIDMEDAGESSNSMIIHEDGKRTIKNCSYNKDDVSNNGARKKLRLTKEQTNFLEERFKRNHTLETSQKQAIAAKLNLEPRQVEVWFQNRRARIKVKQIEVDCEFLKKCCDGLSEENRKLKRELQELRSLKSNQKSTPLFVQLSKASKLTSSSSEKTKRNKERA